MHDGNINIYWHLLVRTEKCVGIINAIFIFYWTYSMDPTVIWLLSGFLVTPAVSSNIYSRWNTRLKTMFCDGSSRRGGKCCIDSMYALVPIIFHPIGLSNSFIDMSSVIMELVWLLNNWSGELEASRYWTL